MLQRYRTTLLGATVAVALMLTAVAGGGALAESPRTAARSEGASAGTVEAAATLACERRANWQRWYATPSRANAVGVWACGWYNSSVYDLVGRVWDTEPGDGVSTSLRITWGNGTTQSVPGTAEGQAFSLQNPVEGTPPDIRECEATCGVGTRPDYLPERNKLAGVFRVMTYNIHHGYDYKVTDLAAACEAGDPTLWKAASTIRRNDPDIVIVNEINRALNPKGGDTAPCDEANQPRDLAGMLDMNYVYCNDWREAGDPVCDAEDTVNNSGNAILSRYPIAFKGHLVLPHEQELENAQRGLIWAEVTVAGSRVPVYATHLVVGQTPGERDLRYAQVNAIADTIVANGHQPTRTKTILAGDMNTNDVYELRRLWSLGSTSLQFNDGFKHISPDWAGFTTPVGESRSEANRRLDYIYTSPLFQHPTRGTAVPWSQSSDHLPVIVDMRQ